MSTSTCGELSCDECSARTAAITAERDSIKQEIELVEHRVYRAEAEVERLRSDRDCEKRLRKDADEFRENAIARAMKAEAEVERLRAGIAACLDTNGHLADGEDCTLIGLKRCFNNPTAARESNGGAA